MALSEDGRFIAFQSDATNLTNLAPEGSQIFVHDVVSGGTVQASVSPAGDGADLASLKVSISWDGRYVVFESHAASLVASDTNGARDLFIAPNPLAQWVAATQAKGRARLTATSTTRRIGSGNQPAGQWAAHAGSFFTDLPIGAHDSQLREKAQVRLTSGARLLIVVSHEQIGWAGGGAPES